MHRPLNAPVASVRLGAKLVGSSEGMRTVQKTIGLLADSDAAVLIMGETGRGKEHVAGATHEFGNRNSGLRLGWHCGRRRAICGRSRKLSTDHAGSI